MRFGDLEQGLISVVDYRCTAGPEDEPFVEFHVSPVEHRVGRAAAVPQPLGRSAVLRPHERFGAGSLGRRASRVSRRFGRPTRELFGLAEEWPNS
jgi:hypothetical protein